MLPANYRSRRQNTTESGTGKGEHRPQLSVDPAWKDYKRPYPSAPSFSALHSLLGLQCPVPCVLRAANKIQVGEKDLAQAFCLSIGQIKNGSERCVYKCGIERGIRKSLLNPINRTHKLFRALQWIWKQRLPLMLVVLLVLRVIRAELEGDHALV